MVDSVALDYIVQEEAALPTQEIRAVDGRNSAALECPRGPPIMRDLRVRVLQISNHDDCEENESALIQRLHRVNVHQCVTMSHGSK